MQTIQHFLDATVAKKTFPSAEFSEWLPFHQLVLKGDALQFVEVRVMGLRGRHAECCEIAVPPGTYTVDCRGVRYGSDPRIAGLRAYPEGLQTSRGDKLHEIPVDLGGIAVVDIATIHPTVSEDEERHLEWLEDICYDDDATSLVSVVEWTPTGTQIPCVDGGFGDGTYQVFELLHDGKVVGLECLFIDEATPYPFQGHR